jgi:probable RNA-binding protein EIF1AD
MGRNKAPTTDLSPGSLPADHLLVQLGVPKGSNNFLCTDTDGIERLVELGTKIRKTVLATRGEYARAALRTTAYLLHISS